MEILARLHWSTKKNFVAQIEVITLLANLCPKKAENHISFCRSHQDFLAQKTPNFGKKSNFDPRMTLVGVSYTNTLLGCPYLTTWILGCIIIQLEIRDKISRQWAKLEVNQTCMGLWCSG